MKKRALLSFILTVAMVVCGVFSSVLTSYATNFAMTNETVSVSDTPDNTSMLVAAYDENNALLGCKIYTGDDTISGNYAEDLSDQLTKTSSIKTFLWDMRTLKPLTDDSNDVLIVYFSRTGTTKVLAQNIHSKTGGDIIELIPKEPYSEDYSECTARATEEINANARPEILTRITNIDQYDTILVGYPIWGNTVPPVVRTFLDSYDLSGKTILPFCTHGGSGINGSMIKMRELCPNSTVTVGLDSSTEISIDNWLVETGFTTTSSPTPSPTLSPTPSPSPTPTPTPTPTSDEDKILVAYFSCTNNTEGIANHIIDAVGADGYEIVPEEPYTSADLNYNADCRANREQNDSSARPAILGSVENMEDYDIIFLGYPIWWGQAPKIIYTFLESYNFDGKTIVPFCTSGSSGVGSSATDLHGLCSNTVTWTAGRRFASSTSSSTVVSWINGLGLDILIK